MTVIVQASASAHAIVRVVSSVSGVAAVKYNVEGAGGSHRIHRFGRMVRIRGSAAGKHHGNG